MANVPVPDALRDELRLSNLAVWEAKRVKKGEPVFVQLAGPGLPVMPTGIGATIEEAVDAALRSAHFRMKQPGVLGALARLEWALHPLQTQLWMEREKVTGVRELDDGVPF